METRGEPWPPDFSFMRHFLTSDDIALRERLVPDVLGPTFGASRTVKAERLTNGHRLVLPSQSQRYDDGAPAVLRTFPLSEYLDRLLK